MYTCKMKVIIIFTFTYIKVDLILHDRLYILLCIIIKYDTVLNSKDQPENYFTQILFTSCMQNQFKIITSN